MAGNGKYTKLALHAAILFYYFFVGYKFVSMYDGKNADVRRNVPEEFKILKRFQYAFFTCWSFTVEIVFLVLATLGELADILLGPNNYAVKALNLVRGYIFSTIVFPCALVVTSVFWSLFLYDRELILPVAIDDFFPLWMNHAMHTVIVVPLVVEVFLPSRGRRVIGIKTAVKSLVVFLTVYQTMYTMIYLNHGVWLYPIYGRLTWVQRIIFTLAQFVLALIYAAVGIFLQNVNVRSKMIGYKFS